MAREFVIDNSVVMAWCFEDETSEYADAMLQRFAGTIAFVPSIWRLEVANVLLVAERKRRIAVADSVRFMVLLAKLPIIVKQETDERVMSDIFSLARQQQLSSYDASYLDLAMRKGVPIASLNQRLLAAARRCEVPLVMGA